MENDVKVVGGEFAGDSSADAVAGAGDEGSGKFRETNWRKWRMKEKQTRNAR